ncbi:MAG: peptidoglycan-binding domain-containing protein [Pyrinomonadaceae bacterium]
MTRAQGAGAMVVEGLEFTGLMEKALTVMNGGAFLIEGVTAIETLDDGVDLAIPVSVAAIPVPSKVEDVPPEVIKESFNAYKARLLGTPVIRMPEVHIAGKPVPRSYYLTGVQYRLNAASFGAGPVDGILGPRTLRAIKKFQEAYREAHNLRVDEVPGPKTQAALVSVCGY